MATLQTIVTESARYVKAELTTTGTPAVYDTDSAEIVQRLISGINDAKNIIARKFPLYADEGVSLDAHSRFSTSSLSKDFYKLISVMCGGNEVKTQYTDRYIACDIDPSITSVDTDYIVAETAMKAADYTIANQPEMECLLSVTTTTIATADTLGTLLVVGKLGNISVTESITPVSGTTVYSTKTYDEITSITGVGWVIGGATADNIKIGIANVYCRYQYIPDDMLTLKNLVSSDTDASYPFSDIIDYRVLAYRAAQFYYEINGGTSARQKAKIWEQKFNESIRSIGATHDTDTVRDYYNF